VSAFEDLVLCGPGFDRVLADSKDMVTPADCEQVRIIQGSRKEVSRQQERFFASLPPIFLEGLPPIGKESTSACPTQIDFSGVGSVQTRRSPSPLRLESPRLVVPSKL
jgi:hypothetical protein